MLKRGALLGVLAVLVAAGCSSPARSVPPRPVTGVLRLGYTSGLADAPALAGLRLGLFGSVLGSVSLQAVRFATTAAETRALRRGLLDAAYLDPVAAVAVWQAAGGGMVKVVAGAASGGAELVVRAGVASASELARGPVAAPAGSAQEVAFDYWLRQHGVTGAAPAAVTMTAGYLAGALRSGRLAGAWEPAPVDVRMVSAGAHVLVDEASLWPGGQFPTAVLVVTTRFLARHAGAVGLLLRGHVRAVRFLTSDPSGAEAAVGRALTAAGAGLPAAVLRQSLAQIRFTDDPLAAALLAEAGHGAAAGLLDPVVSLGGLLDLGPLNTLLRASGLRPAGG